MSKPGDYKARDLLKGDETPFGVVQSCVSGGNGNVVVMYENRHVSIVPADELVEVYR